jgi:hypothetical protein
MNAGVGPPCSGGFDGFPKKGAEGFFKLFLDGNLVRLDLVAEIIFAMVRKLNEIPQTVKIFTAKI